MKLREMHERVSETYERKDLVVRVSEPDLHSLSWVTSVRRAGSN